MSLPAIGGSSIHTSGPLDECLHVQVRMSEYNSLKGQLGQINRKQGGSLAVRDIAGLVKESDVVNTEYLTTQFVVLSKFEKGSFEREYESLTEYVVRPNLQPCIRAAWKRSCGHVKAAVSLGQQHEWLQDVLLCSCRAV